MNSIQFQAVKNSVERFLKNSGIDYEIDVNGTISIPEIIIDGDRYQMGIVSNYIQERLDFYMDLGIEIEPRFCPEVLMYANLVNNGKPVGFIYIDHQNGCLVQKTQLIITAGDFDDSFWVELLDEMAVDFAIYAKATRLITEFNMDGEKAFDILMNETSDLCGYGVIL